MSVVIQVSEADSADAWALLIRHSPGEAYPNRIFVISEAAADALRKAGIQFTELPKDSVKPPFHAEVSGERV
jgi:hypothetical protein